MTYGFSDSLWPLSLDTGTAFCNLNNANYDQPPAKELISTPEKKDPSKDETKKVEGKEDDGVDDVKGEQQHSKPKSLETASADGNETSSDSVVHEDEIAYKKGVFQRISSDTPMKYYEFSDLKVVLENEYGIFSFLVSSHALSLASAVWRQKINHRGPEELEMEILDSDITVKVMRLKDGHPLTLDLIFQILHLKIDEVPSKISFGFLKDIAVVSKKYECGRALHQWPRIWMDPYENLATNHGYEDWIFIATVLQPSKTKAKEISSNLVLETFSKSICGTYLKRELNSMSTSTDSTTEVSLKYLPSEFVEYVNEERLKVVRKIVTLLRQFISDIADKNLHQNLGLFKIFKLCQNDACCDIALGSLIRSLKVSNLWPLINSRTPREWHGSIRALVKRIEGLEMTTFTVRAPASIKAPVKAPTGTLTGTVASVRSPNKGDNLFGTGLPLFGMASATGNKSPAFGSGSPAFGSGSPAFGSSSHVSSQPNLFDNTPQKSVSAFGSSSTAELQVAAPTQSEPSQPIIYRTYERPAFLNTSYTELGEYRPCASAYALGDLITKCRELIKDVLEAGYEEKGNTP
ncbi:hypothetical protein TWF730_003017 [Orbilia blumenaviensis]|uniref:Uncharacterized protein n=1 Tax=Orbilia blumenaviensis TaxID=1796055 RepID=A0AAV9U9D0_9PEZI